MPKVQDNRKWFRYNRGIGFILALVFIALAIYLQFRPWTHRKLSDGFYLGFFPMVALGLMILFSLILIFDSRRQEAPPGLRTLTFKSFLGAVLAGIACLVYFTVMKQVGFLITTPVFLLFAIYLLGIKSWRTVMMLAVAITAIVYGIFTVMGIELPQGILPALSL
jgi:uncharacterized membrane protein